VTLRDNDFPMGKWRQRSRTWSAQLVTALVLRVDRLQAGNLSTSHL
jgi:hypothetical protein